MDHCNQHKNEMDRDGEMGGRGGGGTNMVTAEMSSQKSLSSKTGKDCLSLSLVVIQFSIRSKTTWEDQLRAHIMILPTGTRSRDEFTSCR